MGKLILASPDIGVAPDAREDGGEEEELLMRQALLMSTETEAVLSGLPVRELRARLQARGIPTVGLVEKAELVAALLRGAEQPDEPAGGEREGVAPVPKCDGDAGDAQVLLTFSQRARLLSAAAAGRPTLDGTGKAAAGALLAASPRVGCCGPVSELCPRRSSSLARGCARSLSSSEASSLGHLGLSWAISGDLGQSRAISGHLGQISGKSRANLGSVSGLSRVCLG